MLTAEQLERLSRFGDRMTALCWVFAVVDLVWLLVFLAVLHVAWWSPAFAGVNAVLMIAAAEYWHRIASNYGVAAEHLRWAEIHQRARDAGGVSW